MARLLVLFFASGAAALIYETVWFYLVQLVVGASSISVAVLLCAFMGGMALGSWLLPLVTPRGAHPFKVVAALEAGIAVFGLLIPVALPYVQQFYLTLADPGAGSIALRSIVCFLILTPPTMLMGATLPAISRSFDSTHKSSAVGLLYMTNLLGGATGTAFAGFYLLRVHDTIAATAVAVTLNVTIAAALWILARSRRFSLEPVEPMEPPEPLQANPSAAPVLIAAGLSGLTALGAEVVWTRQLSLLFGASVYTFSLILAVFLSGLGIGGLIGSRLVRRRPDAAAMLGAVQACLAFAIGYGAWAIVNVLPAWQPTAQFLPAVRSEPWLTFAFDALRCGVAMLPATILWGASFPLTLACGERSRTACGERSRTACGERSRTACGERSRTACGERAGAAGFHRHVARVNAINTAGALAGAIVFTLIGIPRLGSHGAQQLLVILAAASGVIVLLDMPDPIRPRRFAVIAGMTLAAVAIVPAVPGRLIAYGRSVNSWDSITRFLYLAEGATASVAVTENRGGAKQFHIAGKVEASDMDIDMRLERMLGHIPALLHPNPKSVLIVGVGAGVTAGALSIHPEVERIVICEIEPVVPRSARAYFGRENHHVFDDPRVELIFDDARHFLQTTNEKFDIITSDPIHPWVRGAATLYSLEYLTLARNHLTPGGVVTQWVPLYETDIASVKSELGTFATVFPDTTLWNPDLLEEGYDLVALGRVEQTPIRHADLQARLNASPEVKQSLADVMLKSAADILGSYAGRGTDLAPWLVDAEINRERHLRLQYLAGLAANTDQRFAIFQGLLDYRRYPADLFEAPADIEQHLRSWFDER